MAIKIIINTDDIEKIYIKCNNCQVTNVCYTPLRSRCVACGKKLSRRYRYLSNVQISRYNYHSLGIN